MDFRPRMNNRIDGFSVVNAFHRRYWEGMVADLWEVDCAPTAGGYYVGGDPRLFILLKAEGEDGSGIEMAEIGGRPLARAQGKTVSFIPGGLEMQTQVHGLTSIRHLDLHFDRDSLARRLGSDFDAAALAEPQFLLDDPGMIALAELIAAECGSEEPLHDLYGDGLTLALLIQVLRIAPAADRKRSKLAQWQMRRVTEFMAENCLRTIRLEELAEITGLSQSYFSHAFKASTGLPPHQWQMRARMQRVTQLLADGSQSLTEIAAETGFADPAHFTRMFRRQFGISPSQWRRSTRA
jgi:AraC family transcriptional regulator